MATRNKNSKSSLDCVALKDDIQAKLWADFQAHKDQFPTFLDFIKAKVASSAWGRRTWRAKRSTKAA